MEKQQLLNRLIKNKIKKKKQKQKNGRGVYIYIDNIVQYIFITLP